MSKSNIFGPRQRGVQRVADSISNQNVDEVEWQQLMDKFRCKKDVWSYLTYNSKHQQPPINVYPFYLNSPDTVVCTVAWGVSGSALWVVALARNPVYSSSSALCSTCLAMASTSWAVR